LCQGTTRLDHHLQLRRGLHRALNGADEPAPFSPRVLPRVCRDSSLSFPQLQGQNISRCQETISATTSTSSPARTSAQPGGSSSPVRPPWHTEQSASPASAPNYGPASFEPSPSLPPYPPKAVGSSLEI